MQALFIGYTYIDVTFVTDRFPVGDEKHGAYLYSYPADPTRIWDSHFRFARAASAYKIQHLRNEAGLPSLEDIDDIRRRYGESAEAGRKPLSKFGDHSHATRADRTVERLS